MRWLPFAILLASAAAALSGCGEWSATGSADRPSFSVGASAVTIDFTSYGEGKVFQPDFYRSDGIVFPAERCGSAGCDTWFVGFTQGDVALDGEPSRGPVQATFTRPISDVSLRVAPRAQGTATYTLSVFAASGELLATTAVTVTQDFGDPANSGFGYFTISLTNLPSPAKRFTLENVFVRSSFPSNTEIAYGVSSISYTHWGKQP
ncbi:MAG: hypothetical protein AUH78_20810 [Gemmatimonadetes bacterium 13_1_40CM_4_69_8]|nr:MAG: hypothetical protein AUH45_07800 [Gemmatimonadetes bacterium 13_1_40CM_69_22]OLC70488.1 MAG: hypothetical protein AUH78_20810 [Gemmatimonadetes bacterium 13_1_40CM_4_69_8]